ncbi:hypothetical protein CCHR01_17856 [Colletotrichum chrysophilum]|uniref:Uncharacterized protein n=1 Tax=Colletotrichum chrysophilum TaxID=1836956 RepID=A0AAD9A1D0_9PEZI|nr:hypothetical protein CCHR01_17856 [Colletotrichum chrysophilum]
MKLLKTLVQRRKPGVAGGSSAREAPSPGNRVRDGVATDGSSRGLQQSDSTWRSPGQDRGRAIWGVLDDPWKMQMSKLAPRAQTRTLAGRPLAFCSYLSRDGREKNLSQQH